LLSILEYQQNIHSLFEGDYMQELHYLKDIVIILGFGVLVVSLLQRLKLPTIAGFILVGIMVGPNGFRLIDDSKQVTVLAEIGVTLLLFGIGLEMPLKRFRRLWKPIIAGGTIQVGLSLLGTFLIARVLGLSREVSFFIGCVVAISSTAIVLRELEGRGEIDAPHGRFTLGILIFQDLCVVPIVLILPLLAGQGGSSLDLLLMLVRAVVVVAAVLGASRLLIPHLMNLITQVSNRYIFIMSLLVICIGTAWITASVGVSLALGAFLGGLVVAGGEYRHQALADIIPFREVFVSIFFVSVGMLLDPAALFANKYTILILMVSVITGKFIVVFIAGSLLRMPSRVSAMTAMALSQVGEFSFILIGIAVSYRLINNTLASNLIAVIVLTMFATPFLLNLSPKVAAGIGSIWFLRRFVNVPSAETASESKAALVGHIIIGGYGVAGAELAHALKECQTPYIIAELNPENVRAACQSGHKAYYADITSPEVLSHLGVSEAKAFIIVINDPTAKRQAIRAARKIAPNIHIMVRARYLQDRAIMRATGADEVVIAEVEASTEIIKRALQRCNVDVSIIERHIARFHSRESDNAN